jgi:hypothetical protein
MLVCALAPAAAAAQQVCSVERITRDPNGADADGTSNQPVMTPDGRYVTYASTATNLVAGDTNGVADIFVRDLVPGTTERVSVGTNGAECDQLCSYAAISDDGRYVVFNTAATTLDPTDTNNALDVYLRDRANGTTERISLGAGGASGDGPSFGATLGGGARYVLFVSWATNLVPGDTNATRDVFLRDRVTGSLEIVSVSTAGIAGNDSSGSSTLRSFISSDGRYVAFGSVASNLVGGDTNNDMDAFLRDRALGTTEFLLQAAGGGQPHGYVDVHSATADLRYFGIVSDAPDLVAGDTNGTADAFCFDRLTGVIERASLTETGAETTGGAWAPVVTDDGRFVLFSSAASDLVQPDPNTGRDIYRRDRYAGRTERVLPGPGVYTQQEIAAAWISAAGDRVAFAYTGVEFDLGDLNDSSDIFVSTCTNGRVFCSGDGTAAACPCGNAGGAGAGCANSATSGAMLTVVGSAHTTDDTLALFVRGMPTNTTVVFMMGSSRLNGDTGIAFGDGLRCVGGTVTLFARRMTAEGSSSWGFGVPGAPLLSIQSNVPSGGDVRWYQAWYRNAANFCTSATHNMTNGLEVTWTP